MLAAASGAAGVESAGGKGADGGGATGPSGGGAIGGGLALLLFGLADIVSGWLLGRQGGGQLGALFGSFSIGPSGYAAVLAQIVVTALVTAATSRNTVNRTLETVQ